MIIQNLARSSTTNVAFYVFRKGLLEAACCSSKQLLRFYTPANFCMRHSSLKASAKYLQCTENYLKIWIHVMNFYIIPIDAVKLDCFQIPVIFKWSDCTHETGLLSQLQITEELTIFFPKIFRQNLGVIKMIFCLLPG